MIENLLRIGQPRGLDPDQVDFGILRQRRHLRDQVLETLAADAAARDAPQLELPPRQQSSVDIHRAEIVDDHRRPFQRFLRVPQPVPQRGGFAAAEKPGQEQEGKRLGAHRAVQLRFGDITFTIAQMHRWMALFFILGAFGFFAAPALADTDRLGLDAKQMIVCLAPDASSFEGTLQLFHRDPSGRWKADSEPWPVLFARNGLAWGRGLNPPQEGPQKTNNDLRNPAGLFKIGSILGYAPSLPDGAKNWPYHQVTERDAWIDDSKLTGQTYNHLYTLPPGAPFPDWWKQEHLHLGDDAYQWLILIEHNYADPDPNAGNGIFFHVRRGLHYRTAGCTTMKLDDLENMIKWLEPGSNAMLAELTPRRLCPRLERLASPPAPKINPVILSKSRFAGRSRRISNYF